MKKRIVVTDNLYLIKGLEDSYPRMFIFVNYQDFWGNVLDSEFKECTYLFDVSSRPYLMIKIIEKIEKEYVNLINYCIIIWGVEKNNCCLFSHNGIYFLGVNENNCLDFEVNMAEKKSLSTFILNSDLTPRELVVLRQVSKEVSLATIARRLNKSIKTVSSQKRSIMHKLGFRKKLSLILFIKSFF